MRILLSLMVMLSGLLMAREFMAHSNEQLRLTLRGAKVVSEQSIATVHEPPAPVATMAVGLYVFERLAPHFEDFF